MPKLNPQNNEYLSWAIYIVFAFGFAWILYNGLALILGTIAPIVVVVSPSMEPVYFRGDAIILRGVSEESVKATEANVNLSTLQNVPFSQIGKVNFTGGYATSLTIQNQHIPLNKEGSIVVYFSNYRQQPIIHRSVVKLIAGDGSYIITKGDSVNNNTIDQDCGAIVSGFPQKNCITLYPIPVLEIQGQELLKIPFIGCVKLWAIDNSSSLLTTGRLPSHFKGIC